MYVRIDNEQDPTEPFDTAEEQDFECKAAADAYVRKLEDKYLGAEVFEY